MAKRPAEDDGGAPSTKRPSLTPAPLDIGPATGQEDLDIKVLQVQNRKLSERLRERNRRQDQLDGEVQKLKQLRLNHLQMLGRLGRQMKLLRGHLKALLMTYGAEGSVEGISGELLRRMADRGDEEEEEEEAELEGVFESVFSALRVMQEKGCKELVKGLKESASFDEEKLQSLEEGQHRLLEGLGGSEGGHTHKLRDQISALEARCEELENTLGNAQFDLHRSQTRCDRLETQLAHSLEELRARPSSSPSAVAVEKGPAPVASVTVPPSQVEAGEQSSELEDTGREQMQAEIAESQALAESRLHEMEDLSKELAECRKECELVKLNSQTVSESAIRESALYNTLKMQYSVVCTENSQLRMCLEEARRMLTTAKQHHFMQLQEIRQEETKYQLEVRGEMAAMETLLASTKRDYELLRIEYEKMMASNEQAAPIAKELHVTVDSLQKTIQQLKGEITRYKNRAHKAEQQLAKQTEEKDTGDQTSSEVKDAPQKTAAAVSESSESKVAELQAKLQGVLEEKRVLEKEVEGWKAAEKDERERGELIAAERRARGQVEEMKRRFEEMRKDYDKRKEHLREEAARKSKSLSEDNRHLQKELSAKKQEAQALVTEMECTAQAFEEMQEQNIRLLQQLKEKDDANFKLMSERIKANNMQKLLLEEKELLQSQINALSNEQARLNDMINQMDEREHNSEATISSMEKEVSLKQQTLEMHKKKALESVQALQESQLKLSEVEGQVEGARKAVLTKTEECERESQQLRRTQEEVSSFKRKLEKYKTREWAATSDEVLLEEIKTYKAKLNCPCCSTRKKDTVLTKCFHVFCFECIRNRYDSRLRKCPKCGAAFGANDFHKIYLS